MNIIAIDIGNTNISIGLYVADSEKFIQTVDGSDAEKLKSVLVDAWEEVPCSEMSTENKRDGVIVASSVKDEWTKVVADICKEELGEKIMVISKDIPLPIHGGRDRQACFSGGGICGSSGCGDRSRFRNGSYDRPC